ncbi:MAG: HIT family protein [Betaproteobacteria bacterium]
MDQYTLNDRPTIAPCAFCHLPAVRIVASNSYGLVVRDGYPVSHGHTLVIARRHIESFFDLRLAERAGILDLLDAAKIAIDEEFAPDGFNIGINDGTTAGQTIPHMHIHLIPRYAGDTPDPRGGVRWVVPSKADYWTQR